MQLLLEDEMVYLSRSMYLLNMGHISEQRQVLLVDVSNWGLMYNTFGRRFRFVALEFLLDIDKNGY